VNGRKAVLFENTGFRSSNPFNPFYGLEQFNISARFVPFLCNGSGHAK
jgi:hypothetical protein